MWNDDSSRISFYFGGFLTPTQKSLVQVRLLQFGHSSFKHVLYLLLSQVIMNLTPYREHVFFTRVPASEEWYSKPVPKSISGFRLQYRWNWYLLTWPRKTKWMGIYFE